jgi:hypothetical protein
MTSININTELFRALSEIAEDETLMTKVVNYVKKLTAKKKADSTLMTKEEFYAKIERAEEHLDKGEGINFTNREDMNSWLNSL